MHFLCLHGAGTNSLVFEMQTAALRYELGDHHTYDFAEGTIPSPIAPEIRSYYPTDDEYYNYFDYSSAHSALKALDDLDAFIRDEGPFDGVMAFSHGACLAATLMIREAQRRREPIFKVAVFLSGGIPLDPAALVLGQVEMLDPGREGKLIQVPAANIWASNDKLYPGMGEVLSALCNEGMRSEFVHEEGHEVPGTRAKASVIGAVRAIRRTVSKAVQAQ